MLSLLKWGAVPTLLCACGAIRLAAQEGPEATPQPLPERSPEVRPLAPRLGPDGPAQAEAAPVDPEPTPRGLREVMPPAAEPGPVPRATESSNVIRDSGNGFGNTIVVENDAAFGPSHTVISGFHNGYGNTITVRNGTARVGMDSPIPAVIPPAFDWRAFVPLGKQRLDWTERRWDRALDCWMYWCNTDASWYWYDYDRTQYMPWYLHPRYTP